MSSPDLVLFQELELFDRDPQEIVERALQVAQDRFPDWEPRPGNTEVVLLEALAVVVSEFVYAVNRLPRGVTAVLMRLFGSAPSEGVAPTTTMTFTMSDTLPHTVPAGTKVRLALGGSADDLDFTTDVALHIPDGAGQGTVAATANRPTDEANGIAAGTQVTLEDPLTFVDTVTLATPVVGGQAPEGELDWLNRSFQRLQRLVTTLVRPPHFTAAALDHVDVFRATTIDNYDPGQVGNPGAHKGHSTTAVLGQGGVFLSALRKTEIHDDLAAQALAILAIHVINPTITNVDVSVSVHRHATHTDAQVIANVTAALNAYLNPDAWPWSAAVRRNELIAIADRAEGVDYVVSVTTPAADVPLPGVAPLARLGAVTVTVTS